VAQPLRRWSDHDARLWHSSTKSLKCGSRILLAQNCQSGCSSRRSNETSSPVARPARDSSIAPPGADSVIIEYPSGLAVKILVRATRPRRRARIRAGLTPFFSRKGWIKARRGVDRAAWRLIDDPGDVMLGIACADTRLGRLAAADAPMPASRPCEEIAPVDRTSRWSLFGRSEGVDPPPIPLKRQRGVPRPCAAARWYRSVPAPRPARQGRGVDQDALVVALASRPGSGNQLLRSRNRASPRENRPASTIFLNSFCRML